MILRQGSPHKPSPLLLVLQPSFNYANRFSTPCSGRCSYCTSHSRTRETNNQPRSCLWLNVSRFSKCYNTTFSSIYLSTQQRSKLNIVISVDISVLSFVFLLRHTALSQGTTRSLPGPLYLWKSAPDLWPAKATHLLPLKTPG